MSTINGLPAHVLLVHAAVVLVPVTAVLVVLAAVWPAARRRLGVVPLAAALVTSIVAPLTTDAGKWLQQHVAQDPLVRTHAELGDGLLPWVNLLLVVAAAVWGLHFWLGRRQRVRQRVLVAAGGVDASAEEPAPSDPPTWWPAATVALAVVAVAVAVGSIVDVYRVGESGARAAWHNDFSTTSGR